jgi:quercetin dioxygenase-like cupin family protein
VEDEVNQLVPGDYFAIPLHKKHLVKVTSSITCKVILQRVAA